MTTKPQLENAPYMFVQVSKRKYIVVRIVGRGHNDYQDFYTQNCVPVDKDGNTDYNWDDVPNYSLSVAMAHRNKFNDRWFIFRESETIKGLD